MMRRACGASSSLRCSARLCGLISFDYIEPANAAAAGGRLCHEAPHELGAPNVITGILLTYRGFDTLGRGRRAVHGRGRRRSGAAGGRSATARLHGAERPLAPASEIVRSGADVLLPLISIFAAYIIMNGHLSAGGGFQGGAVDCVRRHAAAARRGPTTRSNMTVLSIAESLAGVLFVLVGDRRD